MNQYIPQKPISSKHRLPWVDKAITKLIQARNMIYVKWQRSKSPRLREKLRPIRHRLQNQMRQAYWAYMETIIDFPHPYNAQMTVPPSKKGFGHLSGVCGRTHKVFLPSVMKVKFTAQLRERLRY